MWQIGEIEKSISTNQSGKYNFTLKKIEPSKTHKKLYRKSLGFLETEKSVEKKKPRAYGECLGANRRRRTQQAAKSLGELQVS